MNFEKRNILITILMFLVFTVNAHAQLPEKAMKNILFSKKSRELYDIKALKIFEVWKYQFLPDVKTGLFSNYNEACGIKYNSNADITEEIFVIYDAENKNYVTVKKIIYSYENDGVISKRQVYYYDGQKKTLVLNEQEIYAVDSNRNVIEKKVYYKSDIQKSFKYNYDQNSNMIECVEYNSNGDPAAKTINLFDKSGLKYKSDIFLEPDSRRVTTINYDSKENEIQVLNFNCQGKLASSVENIFDISENTEETRLIVGRNTVNITFYKYDELKNIIEKKVVDQNGIIISKTTYKYDDKFNIIEEADFALKFDEKTRRHELRCVEILRHSYNEMNKRSQTIASEFNGKITSKTVYGYKKSE
ncbi:MAG: hypothetical protein QMC67_10850 [Candidatus Wallbacteria bacterium]